METDNILTNQMQVCRPVFLEQLAALTVAVISKTGDIIGQCIQPYIYNVLRVEINRNPPFKGSTGNTQILQARKQEVVHHLIFTGNRLDELRVLIDIIDESLRIFAHTEEICLFLRRLYRTSAVRAFAVYDLGLGPEGLARGTVKSLVAALVNIALIIELLENLLYLRLMILVSGADKFVVGCIHQIPDRLDLTRHVIDKLLRRDASLICL